MALVKKKTSTKTANAPSPPAHPPYLQMIVQAITSLKDRTGSSQPAIAKFVEEEYSTLLPENFKKILSVQLKKFVKSEKLIKVKNSYKVSAPEKAKLAINTAKDTKEKEVLKKVKARTNVGQKRNGTQKTTAKSAIEKAAKRKRLSQVKTPESLKKKVKMPVNGGKMKRLSQIKTPEALKKKKATTPAKKMKVASKFPKAKK